MWAFAEESSSRCGIFSPYWTEEHCRLSAQNNCNNQIDLRLRHKGHSCCCCCCALCLACVIQNDSKPVSVFYHKRGRERGREHLGWNNNCSSKRTDRNSSMTLFNAWKTSVNTAGRKLKPVACINVRWVARAFSIQLQTHGKEGEQGEVVMLHCWVLQCESTGSSPIQSKSDVNR